MTLLERDLTYLEGLYKEEGELLQMIAQFKSDMAFLHCPVKVGDIIKSNVGSFSPTDFEVDAVWMEHRYRGGGYYFRASGPVVGSSDPGRYAFWVSDPLSTEKNNG